MKKSTRDSGTPAYQRIEAHLRALITKGAGRSEPLPAEPDLATEFGVSRMTVRQAYQRLVSAGVVVRYRGIGSFVTGHVFEELPIEGMPDFQSWIVRGDMGTGRRVLQYALVTAPPEVAKAFGLRRAARVTYLQLLRFKNGVPCLDTRYMPAELHAVLSSEQLGRSSLLQSMVGVGYEVSSGQVEIDAHRATREEANLLGIKQGEPVLERRVMFMNPQGRCIVLGDSRYPSGDAYTFRIDFGHGSPSARAGRLNYINAL